MDGHPLDQCWAKLKRAAIHFQTLNAEFVAWKDSQPYRIRHEFDDETGEHVFRCRVYRMPSETWGLIVGDFVHNLRSALDYLVWQLVIVNEEVPNIWNQFPITTTEREWERKVCRKKGWLEGVGPVERAVIKSLQPHDAKFPSKHILTSLQSLSNIDKHRVLTTTLVVTDPRGQGGGMLFTRPDGTATASIGLPVPRKIVLENDTEVMRLPGMKADSGMNMEAPIEVALAFGEQRLTILDLATLARYVRDVVRVLTPSFPQKRPVPGIIASDHA
jgi:hypothetical protein